MSDNEPFVLVDTSVWIELLRGSGHPLCSHLEGLMAADQARICGPVVAELIQGAATLKDLAAAEDLSNLVPGLEGDERTWLEAGRLGQRLRGKGVTVGFLDCYIAVLARTHRCSLLSLDKHFVLIAKHSDLDLDTTHSTPG